MELPIPFREVTIPAELTPTKPQDMAEFFASDTVVNFLESRTSLPKFDYLGYEVKTADEVNAIYLMINPDPRNFALVPQNSLVICHHKVSTPDNRIHTAMLQQVQTSRFNLYNFHLGWDTMEKGIGDSFLMHLGFSKNQIRKVDLTYREHKVNRLGNIILPEFSLGEIVKRLHSMKVYPSVIINPRCQNSKCGYISGGGFVDTMVIEMADYGVDVLVSSDHNFVVEAIASELGLTLVEINHYISERYGLRTMQKLLTETFPLVPTYILEDLTSIQCPPNECSCCI
ncbi:MAG: Nif3-like dinuclear metal center hexameric protein [Candidatus Bathyarchaeota archaeon]|nr:MAG: Nif3-like dinuclear metal center hexameric protein [Candidatus Bathyarchaeota archaeon]